MRIAGTSYTDSLVNQLNVLTAQQYQLQNQVSTGQRIQKPGDDPAGMARALSLQADNSRASQFANNISDLQSGADIAFNALSQIKSASDRAGEIATLADGTKTPAELQAYAGEVKQIIQHVADLANAKNGDHYVFGGTANDSPPFSVTTDVDGNVTGVVYQGNTSLSGTEIADGTTLTTDTPGENNTATGARGLLSDSRYGADFFNHLISLQKDLASGNTDAIAKVDYPALAKDEDNIIFHISNNGVLQSRLESAATSVTNGQSTLQQSLSKVAGADVTQAITDLSQAQNTYKAALSSSAVLLQLQQSVLTYL
jgi:flagellar hook-associated protein 3 FlgL